MTTLFFICSIAFVYWMIREGQNMKIEKRYSQLTADEIHVIGCLMQVSTDSIYGAAIRYNLSKIHDEEGLRRLIREVAQSLEEQPDAMLKILGEEAYYAVAEYALVYNNFLISSGPACPGIRPS